MSVHAEFTRNGRIALPLVRQQHDAAARDYLLGGAVLLGDAVRTDPRLEQVLLLRFQLQGHRTVAHAATKPHGKSICLAIQRIRPVMAALHSGGASGW
jgi:hypothetical protein